MPNDDHETDQRRLLSLSFTANWNLNRNRSRARNRIRIRIRIRIPFAESDLQQIAQQVAQIIYVFILIVPGSRLTATLYAKINRIFT